MSKLSMSEMHHPMKGLTKRTGNNLGRQIHKEIGGKEITNPLNSKK